MIPRTTIWPMAGMVMLLVSGCATVNQDPNILLRDPYTMVTNISNPGPAYQTVGVVEAETSGASAHILNTIPLLYEKAMAFAKNGKVAIGRIRLSSYSRMETVQVPYRDCTWYPVRTRPPKHDCGNGPCPPTDPPEYRYVQECVTRYRREPRSVLHQVATADILEKREER